MSRIHNVAVIVGSLRKQSISRKTALALTDLAPANLKLEIIEIGDLALYNEDVEAAGAPQSWTRFREQVKASDAVLFVTPEYNRSVPGALKNAIDVGSRPYGASAFAGKPAAVLSISPGALGWFGANHHLRQSLVFLDMPTLQQPEAYVGGAGSLINDAGDIADENTSLFFQTFIEVFSAWISLNSERTSQ